jgi:AmiR/NasT family two-component response regulator
VEEATRAELREKVDQLEVAMNHRTLIGTALGIIMERLGLDSDQAFAYVKRVSMDSNVKLYDVAESIVSTRQLPGQNSSNSRSAPTAGTIAP